MLKNIFILFGMLCSFTALGQEGVLLKGRVISDSIAETSINIVNLTRETGTTNNSSGDFEIEVRENDSLLFSSVQYEVVELVVTSEIMEKGYVEIGLVEKTTELEEVSISNISLTGNLSNDAANIKTSTPADFGLYMSEKAPPTSIERKLFTATGLRGNSVTNVSLDGILNSINGRTSMLLKAKKNEDLSFLVEKGMQALPVSFFVDELMIPEDHIKNFVYFCTENPRFSELLPEDKRFALIEYYRKKAPEFLENRMGK